VVLALAMFGFYELQVPAAIQTRLAGLSNQQKAGSYAGTAVMGALSALIVTTCVAPPLVATLAVIGQAGDVVRGALALFALSIGMGTPLLIVGASAGKLLPKAGAWMETVKRFFGVLFLGVAIWMVQRILPGPVALALWGVLLITAVFVLGAFQRGRPASGARWLGRGVSTVAALWGVLMLVGAAAGNSDPFQPLKGVRAGRSTATALPRVSNSSWCTPWLIWNASSRRRKRRAAPLCSISPLNGASPAKKWRRTPSLIRR
jgi:thiol:disulfide interchange protein DsbD